MSDVPAAGYQVPPAAVTAPAPAEREPSFAADLLLRVLGGVLILIGGFGVAALAVLLVPLRLAQLGPLVRWLGAEPGTGLGAVPIPAAVMIAVGGNLALIWLARRATGTRWGGLLPAAGWFVMVVIAIRTTTEGDRLLMPDDWVATLTLFSGTIVLVIGAVLGLAPARPAGPGPAGAPRQAG